MPDMEPTNTPGAAAPCQRCHKPLRVASHRRRQSRPVRLAARPEGVCAECVMTEFLYNTYPPNMLIDEAGPELLLKPGIVDAFRSSGVFAECDLDVAQIDWQRLVANWQLPVRIDKKNPRNPYRMGDSPRARSRRGEADTTPAGTLPPVLQAGDAFLGRRISRVHIDDRCVSIHLEEGGGSLFDELTKPKEPGDA